MGKQLDQSKFFSDQQPNLQSTPSKKPRLPSRAVILIAAAVVILIGLVSYGSYQYFTAREIMLSVDNKGSSNGEITECLKDWERYSHDVIGIKFCYPSGWGIPSTDPIKNITRVSNIKETFEAQNIYNENALNIKFEKNSQVRLRLFNDQYSGKSQRGWNEPHVYYESGSTDDIVSLRNGGSICDYKIGYDYVYNYEMTPNTLKTIYSDCTNGVRVALTQDREFFNFDNIGTLYTYDLRLLSFKKLANGYFDNVLVSRIVDRANQIREDLGTLDGFFNNDKTPRLKMAFQQRLKSNLIKSVKNLNNLLKL